MTRQDFDLRALYLALDGQRRERGLTWAAITSDVNRHRTRGRAIAQSTITSLAYNPVGEGDGILQMLLWLGRTPESFLPGVADPNADPFQLPTVSRGQILRWDTKALFSAIDDERRRQGLTWAQTAREIGGFTPGMLTNLAKGGRIGFPGVMRLVLWLGQPAVAFTRITDW